MALFFVFFFLYIPGGGGGGGCHCPIMQLSSGTAIDCIKGNNLWPSHIGNGSVLYIRK